VLTVGVLVVLEVWVPHALLGTAVD
jgi:hypothetical protein